MSDVFSEFPGNGGMQFSQNCMMPASEVILLLHGCAGNADAMSELATEIQIALPAAAIYAPNGNLPSRDGGYQHFEIESHYHRDQFAKPSTAWSVDEARRMDELRREADRVAAPYNRLLKRLRDKHEMPACKTAIVGFSQGGQLALQMVRSQKAKLATVVSISATLLPTSLAEIKSADRTRILLTHGTADTVLPVQAAHLAQINLEAAGFQVQTCLIPDGDHHHDWKRSIPEVIRHLQRELGSPPMGSRGSAACVPTFGTDTAI